MVATVRQPWFWVVILVGVIYALVGIIFALPAGHVRIWRLAAWVASGVVYAIHVGYEGLRFRNSSVQVALHVASAAALGGFGLALAAVMHSLSAATTRHHQQLLLVALGAWPIITGVPAFLVGLVASGLLARLSRRGDARSNQE
jgi:hypothetical protein